MSSLHPQRIAVHALPCVLALLACSKSLDTRVDGTAMFQPGAAPVMPWALADQGGAGTAMAPGMTGSAPAIDAGAAPIGAGGMGAGMPPGVGTGGMNALGTGGRSAIGSGGMGAIGSGGMGVVGAAGVNGGTGGVPGGPPPGATPTSVGFDVTTLSQSGRYEPANIGAIWIQDSSGNYLKTLEVWASIRAFYLSQWLSVNPFGDRTDAISSATLLLHKAHHVTWDLTDTNGKTVADGDYTIFVEVTDQDFPGQSTSVKFTKGPKPQTLMPADTQYYQGLKLVYQ